MSDATCQEMFNGVEFHDGVINSVSLSIVERTCKIDLSLGDYKVGRARSACLLACTGTEDFFGRFGFEELADNASSGNIQDGRVDTSRGNLRLYLAGGLVEAAGRDVRLAALPRPMDAAETSRVRAGRGGFKKIEDVEFDFSYLESIHFACCRYLLHESAHAQGRHHLRPPARDDRIQWCDVLPGQAGCRLAGGRTPFWQCSKLHSSPQAEHDQDVSQRWIH